ncbi:hypothetical protein LG21E20_12870 [Lactococcus formosensis]|nr:hypothetical protein LG21E20_12870 [Lactococcus formosensis]BDX25213.1 hypothetical protein LFMS200408A_12900 [Lactococcus formosensis]
MCWIKCFSIRLRKGKSYGEEIEKVIIMSVSGLTLLSTSIPSAVGMVQASNVNVVQEPDSKAFDVRNETVQLDITEKTKR